MFPIDHQKTDKSGNIHPGTVVDTQICHPTEFDFYLNSHAGIQVSKVHSLIPPAYYAHLAALRAQHYVGDEYSDGDSTTGPTAGVAGCARFRDLPDIKENVKEVMFYC
ncbi:hypothetical protein C1H46_010351 [Malus baccata]|uniref:Piwi domain-containing protein n=1 Tax=Malus baccata TaxID=106549 RepID=A0A540N096_MALBA|nr:hypothetical protein C1H46_010351 [Malus baccata]